MRKVGVIGLGHVGSTVAYTLVTKGIADELVLIDTNEAKCTAEFYDLLDSLGRLDTYTKLSMNDYKALQDADVVITAFGDIKALADGGNRFLEYSFNCQQAKQVGTALKEVVEKYHPDRIVIEPSGVGKLSDVGAASRFSEPEPSWIPLVCSELSACL